MECKQIVGMGVMLLISGDVICDSAPAWLSSGSAQPRVWIVRLGNGGACLSSTHGGCPGTMSWHRYSRGHGEPPSVPVDDDGALCGFFVGGDGVLHLNSLNSLGDKYFGWQLMWFIIESP